MWVGTRTREGRQDTVNNIYLNLASAQQKCRQEIISSFRLAMLPNILRSSVGRNYREPTNPEAKITENIMSIR
jgi:hypothetical protein